MLLVFAFLAFWEFAGKINLFGSAHAISSAYLIWSAFPFTVLFIGLLILRALQLIGELLLALFRPLHLNAASASRVAAISFVFFIPALALVDWELRASSRTPPSARHDGPMLLGPSGVRQSEVGAITRYLIDHARITPGAPFRGYTATIRTVQCASNFRTPIRDN
jgi:hypothetical protein